MTSAKYSAIEPPLSALDSHLQQRSTERAVCWIVLLDLLVHLGRKKSSLGILFSISVDL